MKLILGDCLEVMRTLPDNSVDSVVTDPPAGISFMGKAWDGADIERMTRERISQAQTLGKDGAKRQIPRCSPSESAGKYDLSPTGNQAFQHFSEEWAREFLGSGSTGVAAKAEGFDFIGIEREAEYFAIAKKRIN